MCLANGRKPLQPGEDSLLINNSQAPREVGFGWLVEEEGRRGDLRFES